MMVWRRPRVRVALLVLGALLTAAGADAQEKPRAPKAPTSSKAPVPTPAPALGLEPRAIDLLKAASSRLAAAKSMAFTAVVTYESPSRLGPPLAYSTRSEVTVQRPDKLRVITLGDGPVSEFYYDGRTMTAFSPAENLAAVADAPSTIDAMLKAAYDRAAIYFPFSDLIVADPYLDIADRLTAAFYIGQSRIVGDVTTDMVAYVNSDVFVQIWIGADDRLPRRLRAVYRNDPARLRHQMDLSGWQLDLPVAADVFASPRVAGATRIDFARPDAKLPAAPRPPAKAKTPKTQ